MERRLLMPLPLIAALAIGLSGCQTGGNTALMERDLRLQEDRIYYLEDKVARLRDKLADCAEENKRLQSLQDQPTDDVAPASVTPSSTQDDARKPSGPDLSMPKIQVEAPAVPATKPPGGADGESSKIIRPGDRRRQDRDNTVARPLRVGAASPKAAPPIKTEPVTKPDVSLAAGERSLSTATEAETPTEKWAPSTAPVGTDTSDLSNASEPAATDPNVGPQLKVSLPGNRNRPRPASNWRPDR